MAENVPIKPGGAFEMRANMSSADVSWIYEAVSSKVPERVSFYLTEKIAYLGKVK